MADRSEILHITLRIGTRQFQMDVERADESYYREAEKLINQRYRFYADRYSGQGNETYLMMTLLDLAVKLKRVESKADTSPMVNALESLVGDIERALP
ncbi:MAG: cell division protein ZapA [Prevotellaceae bacterium]|nr:cell division protein ZapA [Prevotellaceae bacterium]